MRGGRTESADDGGKLRVPAIIGPTAVGKTAAAMVLAEARGWEIVSADSRQVYRRLDVGTAKPGPAETARVPHHLIDVVEPWEVYSCGRFRRDALAAVQDVTARGRIPLVVGGSGLYIRSLERGLFEGPGRDEVTRARLRELAEAHGRQELHRRLAAVDPEAASKIHPRNVERVIRALEVFEVTGMRISELQKHHTVRSPLRLVTIGLSRRRDLLYSLIYERFERMLEAGFADEVARLVAAGFCEVWPSFKTVGYREMGGYVRGEVAYAAACEKAKTATRQFAKRQLTWFSKAPVDVWLDVEDDERPEETSRRIERELLRAGLC
jgi:tRNA dimethylallyltransferase